MFDLTGNLASFDLRRVLRFLAGTGATGELRVHADDVVGRILLQGGSIGYATTAIGHDTVDELDALLERFHAGGYAASSADGGSRRPSLEDVLRDRLIDVLHKLDSFDGGTFDFNRSDSSASDEVAVFTVEDVITGIDVRVEAWKRIRDIVPFDDMPYRMVSVVPPDRTEVTLPASTWALLAAVGAQASLTDLAGALGLSEFAAAQQVADLVEAGLLEPTDARPFEQFDEVPEAVTGAGESWDSLPTESEEWEADIETVAGPVLPRIEPAAEPVTFSKQDLTPAEKEELIRNISRGIFPD